jgi:hypothetical protein
MLYLTAKADPFINSLIICGSYFPYEKNGVYEFVPGTPLWSHFKLVGHTFNDNVQEVRKHYQLCHPEVDFQNMFSGQTFLVRKSFCKLTRNTDP